jgi:four helix bundle protein
MMNEERVKVDEKAFQFAKDIIKIVLSLSQSDLRYTLGKQLMRSGTAIGANIEEAQGGLSKKDFIHSMNIAKKEARETLYWLRLLAEFSIGSKDKINQLIIECEALKKILTSIVKPSQENSSKS